jgi:hypothetical protein
MKVQKAADMPRRKKHRQCKSVGRRMIAPEPAQLLQSQSFGAIRFFLWALTEVGELSGARNEIRFPLTGFEQPD